MNKCHQILLKENMKAAPDIIKGNMITPLKSRIDAIKKHQPPSNKKKIQEFRGVLFLRKNVSKKQLYLKPFYTILRQQNKFEWTTEHQKRFEEIKRIFTGYISNTIQINFFLLCVTLHTLASAQHYCSHITEQKNESYLSKFKAIYTSRTYTLYTYERMYSYNIYSHTI